MESISNLLIKVNEDIATVRYLLGAKQEAIEYISAKKFEKEAILRELDLNTRLFSTTLVFFEKLNERGLVVLDKLMEKVLSKVYPYRAYEVFHKVWESRGSNYLDFFLRENKNGRVIVSNIRNAVGGSIRAILGLFCLIYYLSKTNSQRLICLDESMSQLDDTAVDYLFSFLKEFGKEEGFSYIFVTHDPRFKPYFDKEYRMTFEGSLEKVR